MGMMTFQSSSFRASTESSPTKLGMIHGSVQLKLPLEPGAKGLSYNSAESLNPPESNPVEIFNRLFGAGFRAPGEEPIIDPKLALRRSVLDAVLGDANKLRQRLGMADQARLDQHLTGIRELELTHRAYRK